MKIGALFQKENAIPTAPKVVHELINSFTNEDISIEDIARTLAMDPVLSANILRLANSSYYHVSRRIETVENAISMLGFVTVRTMVITCSLVHGFRSTPGLDLKQFWRCNLAIAVIAKWLAQQARENSDLAFTVGTIHAIGQLMMHAGIPEQMREIDTQVSLLDDNRLTSEKQTFEFNYAEVSAELATRWNFPEIIAQTIQAFPNPLEQQPFNRMAAIIHLASWYARNHEKQMPLDAMRQACPAALLDKLGLPAGILFDSMPPIEELSDGLEVLLN